MMQSPDPSLLIELVTGTMPFGKYKGVVYYKIPVSYLEWMQRNGGFPKGRTGMLLATLYEIRLNGLGQLLEEIRHRYSRDQSRGSQR